MRKNPFLAFMAVVSLMVAAILGFLQSPQFASLVKNILAKRLPGNMGIQGDFSEFRVMLFPPGISLRRPKLRLGPHNILDLPEGSSVTADRLDLRFRPFQMFSGNIRVNEVAIVNGDVNLILSPAGGGRHGLSAALKPDFHWDQLFQVKADAVSVENTKLHLEFADSGFSMNMTAKDLRLGQWNSVGGPGFELGVDVSDIEASGLKKWVAPESIQRLSGTIRVNALGLEMEKLVVTAPGVSAYASGTIKGNVLKPKNLALDADLSLKGAVSDIIAAIDPKQSADIQGDVSFDGKVTGNLDRLSETLRMAGKIEGERVRFRDWHADHLKAQAEWSLAGGGKSGILTVESAEVDAAERPRVGGNQPGDGGKVEVGAFKLPLDGAREPISIPVTFDRAHLHWLAASVLKKVYPLDLRISGPVAVDFVPGVGSGQNPKRSKNSRKAGWTLQAKLGLTVSDFQLDNQRLGKVKPLKRILKVPKIGLEGPIVVDPTGIKLGGLNLSMPRTKFAVAGRIDFNTGYDFTATGDVNLEDVGQISENDIRGTGSLTTHVHGPSSRVLIDFDADLKDAEYLRLNLGDLHGRITWDDGPNHLLFTQVQVSHGRSSYRADGVIDTGPGADSIDLSVNIPQGDPRDFGEVFGALTQSLWWYPHSLNGDMKGSVKVTGGLSTPELVVAADVTGSNWEYAGERFRTVSFRGGYDKGKYYIDDLRAMKQAGKLTGHISFDAENRFDWALHTDSFTLTDIEHLARLDVPFRGRLQIDSKGQGQVGSIVSDTEALLSQVTVRGTPLPPSEGTIRSGNGVTQVKGTVGGGQAVVDMTYDARQGAESYVRAELRRFDFSPVLLLLNSKSMQDPELQGIASGLLQLKFKTGAADRASGNVDVSEYVLAKSGVRFDLDHPVSFRVNDGSFDVRDLALRGSGGATAVLNLASRSGQLEGDVSGQMDVSVAQFFTSSIAASSGAAGLDYSISGTLRAPQVFGKADVEGAGLRIASFDSPFENVSGTFQLRQNVLTVQNLVSDLAGGRVSVDGTIQIFPDRYPEIDLKGDVSGSRVKFFPFQYAKVSGKLEVSGDAKPYLVSGNVIVDQAVSHEKVLADRQNTGLKTMQYTPPPTAQRDDGSSLFRLKIDASADRGIQIQNDLFDAEAKGKVTVVGTLDTPRILGTAELIQGKLNFKDRQFLIQTANADFDNPTVIDPLINLAASTEVSNTKIQLVVSGHMSNLKVDLSSNPAMGESDILSLLTMGQSTYQAQQNIYSTDRSAMESAEGLSMLLNGLDFNREVQNKTGLKIQVDESVNTIQAQSIFSPHGTVDTSSSPKIVITRQIGQNLGISYGSTVGVGSNRENEVNAELHVTPGFSLLGIWDYFETMDTKTMETSFGADLKLQKRFK